jgi:hypothetical protein
MPISYPQVDPNDVKMFAKAWDCNGIKMILDATSLKFAVDFANVVLRSYVNDLVEKAAKAKAAKGGPTQVPTAVPTQVNPAPAPKSSIILTDC